MKRYRVGVRIEELWVVDVDAEDEDDADARVCDMDEDEIRKLGELEDFEKCVDEVEELEEEEE